ncbi:MAG: hypothetical protein DA408_19830 [Bacteroidetes bacterium]|nr:MAG: hypothetical protein C7N36_12215 [Bacteroidota bacterium]PTM08795.1 MAG: hypothetical protein DA408_19830 [Bacteroidota bacterium]
MIKLPIDSTPRQIQDALDFLRYLELGEGNQITQDDVDQLAQESKKRWWEAHKERFKNVEGFEGLV